jgi:5-hydroxyisourate hydrolase-like protein (transthyretin family)
VKPNLELRTKRHVAGTVKDQSGAPFAQSRVLIQKFRDNEESTTFKEVMTDEQGRFDFGTVGAGRYRFLPSPNRAFKQPKRVSCGAEDICELDLTLEVNPSDQAFMNCPIQ